MFAASRGALAGGESRFEYEAALGAHEEPTITDGTRAHDAPAILGRMSRHASPPCCAFDPDRPAFSTDTDPVLAFSVGTDTPLPRAAADYSAPAGASLGEAEDAVIADALHTHLTFANHAVAALALHTVTAAVAPQDARVGRALPHSYDPVTRGASMFTSDATVATLGGLAPHASTALVAPEHASATFAFPVSYNPVARCAGVLAIHTGIAGF